METETKPIDIESLPIDIIYRGETSRDDWDCFEYEVRLFVPGGNRVKPAWTTRYYCGKGHINKNGTPKKPEKSDVLSSLFRDAEAHNQSFPEWCSDFGYSDDSIKALNIYKNCCEIWDSLQLVYGFTFLEDLKNQLRDY